MRHILTKFIRDESGAYAVTFGVMAVALFAFGGATIDFVRTQKVRTQAQIALDAATLTLHKEIDVLSDAQLMQRAEDMIEERMEVNNLSIDVEAMSRNVTEGQLAFQAQIDVPTVFVRFVNVDTMPFRIQAEVKQAAEDLEVAFVLDNSGSMGSQNRLTNLKIAANNAIDIIFDSATASSTVKAGIVPFASLVNVGPANASEYWIDQNGLSSIADDNFDTSPVNRLALYNSIPNATWRGCVEARPYPLDVQDDTPSVVAPDTLIVPSFAPDNPSVGGYPNSYVGDSGGTCPASYSGGGFSHQHRQERFCKYDNQTVSWPTESFRGPNQMCSSLEIRALSTNRNALKNHVNAMIASGGTNIHQGAVWGWRVLSPNAPFSEGLDPTTNDVKKVMIVMTDGQNFYSGGGWGSLNGSYYYSAYGYPSNNRLGANGWSRAQLDAQMNVRTSETCENAKDADIEIYTIGLNSPNSTTTNMLTNCATSASHAYFPNNAAELITVFETIASNLGPLRLSR